MASHLETCSRSRWAVVIVALVAPLVASAVARADTVYLKNGRTLSASQVEVLEAEGRVILHQGANRVVIPLSIVDRIVEDSRESEIPEPGTAAPQPAAPTEQPAETAETDETAAEQPTADEQEAEAEQVPPEETRAYWQDAVRAIEQEKADLQSAIQVLRREERAFLFSHRSTAETKAKIEAAQTRLAELDQAMEDLRREARRKGIPPGWLRLDPQTGDSDQGA